MGGWLGVLFLFLFLFLFLYVLVVMTRARDRFERVVRLVVVSVEVVKMLRWLPMGRACVAAVHQRR